LENQRADLPKHPAIESRVFCFHLRRSNTKPKKGNIMAIVLEANYTKKLGLPGYSSHQYSVTLRTEVADLGQVQAESARLHSLLQSSVDQEIQKVGYLPQSGNGNGRTYGNGQQSRPQNGNSEAWSCSPKQ
jgi:hypothetical protein